MSPKGQAWNTGAKKKEKESSWSEDSGYVSFTPVMKLEERIFAKCSFDKPDKV